MAIRIEKRKAFFYVIVPVLLAWGYHVYHLVSFTPAPIHPAEGPFSIDTVRVAPIPLKDALAQGLRGVLVHTEGEVERVKITRGKVLLLWVSGTKVVAYPHVARGLSIGMLSKRRWWSVTGVLIDHPRYGLEVVLRRASDLKTVQPPF